MSDYSVPPNVSLDDLRAQLAAVQAQREALARVDSIVQQREEAFEASLRAEYEALRDADHAVKVAEDRLRILALARFAQTGEKSPLGRDVVINVLEHYRYDPSEALAWAETHAPLVISKPTLNSKHFERVIATEQTVPAFVTIERDPMVKLAKQFNIAAPVAPVVPVVPIAQEEAA
jgi:hypothetical protein